MNTDLISRKALLEILRPLNDEPEDMMSDEYFEWDNMCSGDMLNKVLETVEAFPAIDAEPVRHSYWDDSSDGITPYCSVCGMSHNCLNRTPGYRPNCGAKMDGGTKTDVRND